MTNDEIGVLGFDLFNSWQSRTTISPLIERVPGLSVEEAYRIQKAFVSRRLADGEHVIGKKIGVTSKVLQSTLGVFQPDFGQLTSDMLVREGEDIDLSALIQPRAEAEIAFVLKHDLAGPDVTAADVVHATDYVVPCFEIVDSRIDGWKIAIQDTIADNASCGVFALGSAKGDLREIDLALAGMVLEKNGEVFSTSAGAAVQGSPVNAVAWLANTLGRLGIPFRAGEIILSGSQSVLVPVADGDELVCTVGGLGRCSVRFSGRSAA